MIVQFKYKSLFGSPRRVVGKLLSIWSSGVGPFKVTKFRVQTVKSTEEFKLHYVVQSDMAYMKDCLESEQYWQGVLERTAQQREADRKRFQAHR